MATVLKNEGKVVRFNEFGLIGLVGDIRYYTPFRAHITYYYTSLEVKGDGKKKKSRNQTVLDGFDHFYYLTSDAHGETILRLLCDPELKEILDGILMQGLPPVPHGSSSIDCDAIGGDNAPVSFGYTCDMPRIQRFVHGLMTHGRKGVYCFDFQEEAVRQICGPQTTIQCIDFEAVERLLWEIE